jgi:hypothetical protein
MVTMMQQEPFTFDVDADLARRFSALPAERRRKLELVLNLRLRDLLTTPPRPLADAMDEIGKQVAANGLTEAELESILEEPHVPGGPRH